MNLAHVGRETSSDRDGPGCTDRSIRQETPTRDRVMSRNADAGWREARHESNLVQ
jgi:hypothetical protein